MRFLAAGLCAGLILTACGGGDDGPPAGPGGVEAAQPTAGGGSAATEDRDVGPIARGDVADAEAAGDGPAVVLTDVRVGAHRGFDRIVFEVAGEGQAGWQVGYHGDPRPAGPIEVPGEAVLGIVLTNIAQPGDAPGVREPWSGPGRLGLDGTAVLETLVAGGLVEGRHTFLAGLDRRRPFAVGQLDSPPRVVVDLLEAEPRTSVPLSQRCESPAGYAIAYPEGWSVNSGETVPACTRFSPDPFRVPAGTDARVGAITASVRSSSFDRIVSSQVPPIAGRTDIMLDGRRAARIERVSLGQGLYPAGVRMTGYVVDLEPVDAGPRTLVVDTVGLPTFDYAQNTRVLDRMMATLELRRG
jgi:hypothetical protein